MSGTYLLLKQSLAIHTEPRAFLQISRHASAIPLKQKRRAICLEKQAAACLSCLTPGGGQEKNVNRVGNAAGHL
jgi:hypothetical protein